MRSVKAFVSSFLAFRSNVVLRTAIGAKRFVNVIVVPLYRVSSCPDN